MQPHIKNRRNRTSDAVTTEQRLLQLKNKVSAYIKTGLEGSANTRKAYRSDLAHFQKWCEEHQLAYEGAVTAEILSAYLAALADTCKWATIQRRLSALQKLHELQNLEFPKKDRHVVAVLEGIRRTYGVRQKQAPAMDVSEFREIILSLDGSDPIQLRDKVVLLLGFTGAFRRSELVSLNLDHLHFSKDGLIIRISSSKTNQYGEIEEKAFFFHEDTRLCPIRTLETWLSLRGETGPLLVRFRKGKKHGETRLTEERLSDKSVNNIVKHYLGAGYSAHSLRASFVTSAKLNGADDLEVMQQTKHKTSLMIQRYTRTDDVRKYNAGKKLGL